MALQFNFLMVVTTKKNSVTKHTENTSLELLTLKPYFFYVGSKLADRKIQKIFSTFMIQISKKESELVHILSCANVSQRCSRLLLADKQKKLTTKKSAGFPCNKTMLPL